MWINNSLSCASPNLIRLVLAQLAVPLLYIYLTCPFLMSERGAGWADMRILKIGPWKLEPGRRETPQFLHTSTNHPIHFLLMYIENA
ncbi:hypothetical protein XENTR_v10014712 [Xenopus tropicalis]|nr:hypothetical protein XENTR_v10014712 [Xenopus tropicalis]